MADKYYWALLIFGLLFLSYAAFAIAREKNFYQQTSHPIFFKGMVLKIPAWWAIDGQDEFSLCFKREDTHYDWFAQFNFFDKNEIKNQSAEKILTEELEDRKIVIDHDTQIKNNLPYGLKLPCEISFARIEGCATINTEERIYIDLVILKKESQIWRMSSQSSILNGCVEGPYFEEVIKNISYQ